MKKNYVKLLAVVLGGALASTGLQAQDSTACFASEVISYSPGLTSSGEAIPVDRADPNNALGMPEDDDSMNFVSLGYGGSITLAFGPAAMNGPGSDIFVTETTYNNQSCASYNESAEVFFSQDGNTWVSAGVACTDQTEGFDIAALGDGSWTWVGYIRFVDVTPDDSPSADAYDVDGVVAVYGCDNPPLEADECYGSEVLVYNPGTDNMGGMIAPERMDPNQATGAPEMTSTLNFVSLGFGGSLIMGFNEAALNGPGADIMVYETTYNDSWTNCETYNEEVEVYLSQDGVNFVYVGNSCTHGGEGYDISDANPNWEYVTLIKFVDISDINGGSNDGYDIDGVVALNGCDMIANLEIPGECYAASVIEYHQGTRMNGNVIPAIRSDVNEVLGEPERNDTYNFFSLGYDSVMTFVTVGFNGSVPNGDGDDIEVVETTFNNDGCETYIEEADIYVSLNGIDWFFAKHICRADNKVDISDAGDFDFINYVRIVNSGSVTDDAYDVDGVVALHNCEDEINPGIADISSAGTSALSSYPNPTAGNTTVTFVPAKSIYTTVEVYDMSGRNVETLFAGVPQAGQEYRMQFDASDLPNGVYIYRLTSNDESVIEKFMIAR